MTPNGVDNEKVYEVKPGDSLEYGIYVKDLIRMYHLENYKGKIEVGFAEANGHLYSKKFRKSNLKIKTKNLKNLMNVRKNV